MDARLNRCETDAKSVAFGSCPATSCKLQFQLAVFSSAADLSLGSWKRQNSRVPEFHAEPYVYLAGLSHKTALIAWGAFYFRARSDGRAKLVDDEDLQWVHPPRCESIGCRSAPYGPARVEVRDESGAIAAEALTNTCNHCAISGLKPNTRYTYTVTVKHELWGAGVRWDWDPQVQGLVQRDKLYTHEFRTLPDPQAPLDEPFSFIVIGDFGTGIRRPSDLKRRQFEVAQALERAVDEFDVRLVLTTGDNIYASKRFLLWTADSGDGCSLPRAVSVAVFHRPSSHPALS